MVIYISEIRNAFVFRLHLNLKEIGPTPEALSSLDIMILQTGGNVNTFFKIHLKKQQIPVER